MTITMKTKNQITIPKKITNILGLHEGDMFNVVVCGNSIQLIPLEVSERVFSKDEHAKLEALAKKEHGREKKVTDKFIRKLDKTG